MSVFQPILAGATLPDRLIACIGAAIGIALTIIVCGALPLSTVDLPIIVAPLGASAVLVFAVPSSPLAKPWPVIGGNILSTLVGVAAFRLVPGTALAAGAAVGGAILVMSIARCLHPPGGAAALTAVIGSEGIHTAGYGFALTPVGINSVALVLVALLFRHVVASRPAAAPRPRRHRRFDCTIVISTRHSPTCIPVSTSAATISTRCCAMPNAMRPRG
ncbi:HPP family protein [Sphingomonas sp. 22R3R2A-7]|uniref:HPP family protein n=1 Tax=Sphingomonas sp. 22R3R2A-7 TaxID=3050230 RepID=UPI002FE0419B